MVTPSGQHLSKLSTAGTPKGQLHLPARGSAGMLRGVTVAASAENFGVASWRARGA